VNQSRSYWSVLKYYCTIMKAAVQSECLKQMDIYIEAVSPGKKHSQNFFPGVFVFAQSNRAMGTQCPPFGHIHLLNSGSKPAPKRSRFEPNGTSSLWMSSAPRVLFYFYYYFIVWLHCPCGWVGWPQRGPSEDLLAIAIYRIRFGNMFAGIFIISAFIWFPLELQAN